MRAGQWWAMVVPVATLLSACGGGKSGGGSSVVNAPGGSAWADKAASAEDVAKEARRNVSCPAKDDSPPRAAGAMADDIMGVRPGMGYEAAATAVACTNDLLVITAATGRGFTIQTYGQTVRQGFDARFAEPRVVKSSKQIMQEMQDNAIRRGTNSVRDDLKPGQAKWFVGTMGMPGQERVLSVAREERFDEGKNPPIETVKQALIKKYGTPSHEQVAPGQLVTLTWASDPLGRPVPETSPLSQRCVANADPDAGVNLSPDCGIVVAATLIAQRANPDLAERMQVTVVSNTDGTKLLTATEQGLQQADAARRAQEVQKAAKDTKAPSL